MSQSDDHDFAQTDAAHRAPVRRQFHSTDAPLIVTPTLVSRVDSTPWSERPHDAGSSVDRSGREVEHPDQHADRLGLEPNKNVAFEHWDEYWRKVHGPKFAYNEPGSTSELVLRYDQLHRIASGPSSQFRPPYRAMTDEHGRLLEDPSAHVPSYGRPRWDGLAYIAYGSTEDIGRTLEQEKFAKRIIADEQTAFRVVTRGIAREHIIIPSALHRDAVSLVKIHVRRPEHTRESFQQWWLNAHVDAVLSKPATHTHVRRYAQLHTIGSTQDDPEGEVIDGISVLSFASLNDVEDYLSTADYREIEQHEHEACSDAGEFWTALNYSVINRLAPELATARNTVR